MNRLKNIYVIGATSTGKTSLVNEIEARWNRYGQPDQRLSNSDMINPDTRDSCQTSIDVGQTTIPRPVFIREVARSVLKTLNSSRNDLTSSATKSISIQQAILQAQYDAEMSAPSWYISDRSAVDPIVYATMLVGKAAAEDLLSSSEWLQLEARMKENGVVFVCEAGQTSWLVDDGTRLMPKSVRDWENMDRVTRAALESRGIQYTVIPKNLTGLSSRADFVLTVWRDSHENLPFVAGV